MRLVKALEISETAIPSLLTYYESTDQKTLTKKISSIPAFESILAPMQQKGDGWIPDFKSRYFTEDFPYGLRYIKQEMNQLGLPSPIIDKVYQWGIGQCQVNKHSSGLFRRV